MNDPQIDHKLTQQVDEDLGETDTMTNAQPTSHGISVGKRPTWVQKANARKVARTKTFVAAYGSTMKGV